VKQALVRDPTQQAASQDPERIAALVALDIDVRKSAAAQKSTVGTMQRRDNALIETFEANLKMETPPNCAIAVEEALYPMLFPDGKGGKPDGYPLSDYLEYRISQFFSPFTLYKPYLPMMYAARRTQEILENVTEVALRKEVEQLRRDDPDIERKPIYRSVIRTYILHNMFTRFSHLISDSLTPHASPAGAHARAAGLQN
jgi:hypothetical protein